MIRLCIVFAAASLAAVLGMDAHPASTAVQWLTDPKAAADAADAAAKHTGGMGAAAWTGIAALGMTVLAGLRMAAPLVPGLGPAWAWGVDFLWKIGQHKDAKLADAAQARVATAAKAAADTSRRIKDLAPDMWSKLPADVRDVLEALQRAG